MSPISFLRSWLRQPGDRQSRSSRPRRPAAGYRPLVELLEDRLPPGALMGALSGPAGVSQDGGTGLPQLLNAGTGTTPAGTAAHAAKHKAGHHAPAQTGGPARARHRRHRPNGFVTISSADPSFLLPTADPSATADVSVPAAPTSTAALGTVADVSATPPRAPTTPATPPGLPIVPVPAPQQPAGPTGGPATPPAAVPTTPNPGGGAIATPPAAGSTVTITGVSADTGDSASDGLTNATQLTVHGTAPAGATVGVGTDVPGASGSAVAGADGTWSYAVPVPLPEGQHAFSAWASTNTGRIAVANPYHVTVDLTAPRGDLLAPTSTANATPTVVVSRDLAPAPMSFFSAGPEAAHVAIDVDLNHDGKFDGPGERGYASGELAQDKGGVEVKLPALQAGTYQLQARLTDAAGNESTTAPVSIQVGGDTKATPAMILEPNVGQANPGFDFVGRATDYTVGVSRSGVDLVIAPPGQPDTSAPVDLPDPTDPNSVAPPPAPLLPPQLANQALDVRLSFQGAQPAGPGLGMDLLQSKTNYLWMDGAQPNLTNIPNFREAQYQDLYRGIDAVYRTDNGSLEYAFVVKPGADPGQIRFNLSGVGAPTLNAQGGLSFRTPLGEMTQAAPVFYQMIDGVRHDVTGRYVVDGSGAVSFQVDAYDMSHTLVIDPTLSYTLLVGSASKTVSDTANAIAVDTAGNAYLTGNAGAPNKGGVFGGITPGSFDPIGVGGDAYVFKLDPNGTLLYGTYLATGAAGVASGDVGRGIAVDSGGNAYVTGNTQSREFALPAGGPQLAADSVKPEAAFVAKLNNTGTALAFSKVFGQVEPVIGRTTRGTAIALDPFNNAYVTGFTDAENLQFLGANGAAVSATGPIPVGTYQTGKVGSVDAFVLKFGPNGDLEYGTYLGGVGDTRGTAIKADDKGRAYVAGFTNSPGFLQANGAQTTQGAGQDGFVFVLSPGGTSRVFSTYLGGNGNDVINGLALDADKNVYVTGSTASTNFQLMGAIRSTKTGTPTSTDAFVTKLTADLGAVSYSTLLGGSRNDSGNAITVDEFGRAYVAGSTSSRNFVPTPTTDSFVGANRGGSDGFVTVLNSAGNIAQFQTYLGSSGNDSANGIALDGDDNVYVAGTEGGTDFTPPAAVLGIALGDNAFVTKFSAIANGSLSGAGGNFTPDRFEPNETSDRPHNFGGLVSGPGSVNDLSIVKHANGLPDYDWYKWTADVTGTFTVTLNEKPGSGDLELHLFKITGTNTLTQVAQNVLPGQTTKSLATTLNAGQPILVEVKGREIVAGSFAQGGYDLNVDLE
jgi:hypothetical protein